MSVIWTAFSFILIILAFYLILHLYQRIRVLEQVHSDRTLQDIEEAFTTYLADVREENDRFAARIQTMMEKRSRSENETMNVNDGQSEAGEEIKPAKDKEPGIPKNGADFERYLNKQIAASSSPQRQVNAQAGIGSEEDWMPPIEEMHDTVEESLYVQAVKLQKKGYTVTEIARQLNRGKGEIELLLKFQGKLKP
ncbi:hypothetical protein EWI07_02090 [Sporolactobacillus sp. THM7-4]|nr:hypothetical protein EWI07_02090 [Sporolactobacillus sp. THM7-4]